MKKFISYLILLVIPMFGLNFSVAHSADIQALNSLFSETFNSFFEDRQCKQNIQKFVQEAVKRNINLSNAKAVIINGEGGFWNMIPLYSRGRDNWGIPDPPGWYYHVVLVADDWVYDYHFKNEPTVVKLNEYLSTMFVPNPHPSKILGNNDYDVHRLMRNWEVSLHPAEQFAVSTSTTVEGVIKKSLSDWIQLEELFVSRNSRNCPQSIIGSLQNLVDP